MPITAQQADNLRSFFTNELQINGYADVIRQVNVRLARNPLVDNLAFQSYTLLMFYIDETLDILRSMSIQYYGNLFEQLNSVIEGQPITSLIVRGIDPETIPDRDLSSAPDYSQLITQIEQIRAEIQTQNELP